MKVLVADKCGFCPGVRNAISTAEQILAERGKSSKVFSLGPIIHNQNEVERLAQAGLNTVKGVDQIDEGTVLIRSHGAAPEQLARLGDKGLDIVDATCVLVKRLQQIATQLEEEGYHIVIIGEANHPEVQAVMGCVHEAVVVADQSDLHRLTPGAKLGVVCQTTQSPEHFGYMLGAIVQGSFKELKVINTLCKESCKRQESAVQLCKNVEIMFVLGGLHSANTRRLADLCKQHNSNTYHLQSWKDFDRNMLQGTQLAGVTAGASTPDWIIKEFVGHLSELET